MRDRGEYGVGAFKEAGLGRGFKVVESGPLVRSSYHADDQADRLTGIDRQTHVRMQGLIEQARGGGSSSDFRSAFAALTLSSSA